MRSMLYTTNRLSDVRDANYGITFASLSLSLSLSLEILGLRAFFVSSIYS